MAKTKETTQEETKGNSEISKNLLGSLLKGYENSHFNFEIKSQKIIPSGSLKLDMFAQVKSGTTIRIGGPPEGGKTSQSLLFALNYMKTFPKSKTIYVNAEAKFASEIQERTGMKYTMSSDTWDYGTVFIFQTNDFNTISNTLKSLLTSMHEQGENLCIIIDSVDMLKLQDSNDKKIGENKKPAGVNWLTKEMFRQLGQEIQGYNAFLIMITQYAAVFQLDQYTAAAPHMMDGNNTHALNHLASYGFYYRQRTRTNLILENPDDKKPDPIKNKILGVIAIVDIKKSASDETGMVLEIPIKKGKVGNCIWTEKEIFDVCFMNGLVKQSGAWIDFSDVFKKMAADDKIDLKPKHQGIAQFSEYFENNPKITEWVINTLRSTLTNENV